MTNAGYLSQTPAHSSCDYFSSRYLEKNASSGKWHTVPVKLLRSTGSSFNVLRDGHLLQCANTLTEAFDYSFKFCWVFNLEYPPAHQQFFSFFRFKVYKLQYGPKKPSQSVSEVAGTVTVPSWCYMTSCNAQCLMFDATFSQCK